MKSDFKKLKTLISRNESIANSTDRGTTRGGWAALVGLAQHPTMIGASKGELCDIVKMCKLCPPI